MAEVDDQTVKVQAIRLLDKAGKDPRLTLRILREKCEDRLKLSRYALTPRRDMLKKLTMKWLAQNPELTAEIDKEMYKSIAKTAAAPTVAKPASSSGEQTEDQIIQQLAKFANAKGKLPLVKAIVKGSEAPKSVKIVDIRKKLRAEGLSFSDIPSDKEIIAAQNETVNVNMHAGDPAAANIPGKKRQAEPVADPQPPKAPRAEDE